MTLQESPQARLLARLMSALSEDHWCAGWNYDCEFALWADMKGSDTCGHKGWGIPKEEIEELEVAHELAGGWVMWSAEDSDLKFVTTEEWLSHISSCSPVTT